MSQSSVFSCHLPWLLGCWCPPEGRGRLGIQTGPMFSWAFLCGEGFWWSRTLTLSFSLYHTVNWVLGGNSDWPRWQSQSRAEVELAPGPPTCQHWALGEGGRGMMSKDPEPSMWPPQTQRVHTALHTERAQCHFLTLRARRYPPLGLRALTTEEVPNKWPLWSCCCLLSSVASCPAVTWGKCLSHLFHKEEVRLWVQRWWGWRFRDSLAMVWCPPCLRRASLFLWPLSYLSDGHLCRKRSEPGPVMGYHHGRGAMPGSWGERDWGTVVILLLKLSGEVSLWSYCIHKGSDWEVMCHTADVRLWQELLPDYRAVSGTQQVLALNQCLALPNWS
jgi:hypothetical protein